MNKIRNSNIEYIITIVKILLVKFFVLIRDVSVTYNEM
jgi:hypothetical protein